MLKSHPTWVRGLKYLIRPISTACLVAPHVGAWIEIYSKFAASISSASHPTWVRGLKFVRQVRGRDGSEVAPHVGAWIEIRNYAILTTCRSVAPHVGAWIEIR